MDNDRKYEELTCFGFNFPRSFTIEIKIPIYLLAIIKVGTL